MENKKSFRFEKLWDDLGEETTGSSSTAYGVELCRSQPPAAPTMAVAAATLLDSDDNDDQSGYSAGCTGSRGRLVSSSLRRRRPGGGTSFDTTTDIAHLQQERTSSATGKKNTTGRSSHNSTSRRTRKRRRRKRIPVIYNQEKIGFLSVSSKYLCFTATAATATATNATSTSSSSPLGEQEKWEWKSLNRVIANAATTYMKIGHKDSTKQSMFFQFSSTQDLMEATNEFQSYLWKCDEEEEDEDGGYEKPTGTPATGAEEESIVPLYATTLAASDITKSITPTATTTTTLTLSKDNDKEVMMTLERETPIIITVGNVVEKDIEQDTYGVEEAEDQVQVQEEEEEDDDPLLTKDAYSLWCTSHLVSKTSLFAGFSISLQIGMLMVNFFDLFDTSKQGNETNGQKNRMKIPVGSTTQVMIAQLLGMLLTAMVMAAEGDFVKGITKLIKGFSPEIKEKIPHATWGRWLFTSVLQAYSGALLLINSFLLSMQSTTVIDLSLNLTALYFIQEIDDMAFTLGSETQLLGKHVKEDCKQVENLKGQFTKADRRRIVVMRRCVIAVMTIGLLAPYILVITQQADGYYLCNNLYLQFGDEYTPEMVHYSGMFKSQGNSVGERIGERNYYVDDMTTYKLAYCKSDNYWTISSLNENECQYIYRSVKTETFDIMEVADENWYVNAEFNGMVAADWLKIVCNDCTTQTCPSKYGVCSEDGDKCICDAGRFGLNCQFWENCMFYALDERTMDGLTAIPGTSSFLDAEYTSLDAIANSTTLFYDMPVYFSRSRDSKNLYEDANLTDDKVETLTQVSSFIIFTGRRWVLYAIPDEMKAEVVKIHHKPTNWTLGDFHTFFDELSSHPTSIEALIKLTSHLHNYFPLFFSSPINYAEASLTGGDVTHVTWVHATSPYNRSNSLIPAFPDDDNPVPAKFLCTNCFGYSKPGGDRVPDNSLCENGGYCDKDGYCVCETYYRGFRCERINDCVGAGGCGGGGKCNEDRKSCDCQEGSYGSLCQIGLGAVEDPFLCSMCWYHGYGGGKCNNTFSQECTCDEGYGGKYCNETVNTK